MRHLLLLPLLLFPAALGARAGDAPNETVKHLGPSSSWLKARLTLEDVPPLGKGVTIAVEGSGRCVIREVDLIAQSERRFELTLERDESLSLFALAADRDLLATPAKKALAPGEERASLALENALGIRRRSPRRGRETRRRPSPRSRPPSTPSRRRRTGRLLTREARALLPRLRGRERDALDLLGPAQDPVFELTDPDDYRAIEKALADLPETTAPKAGPPGLGYRGILLNPRGLPALPRWVSVFSERSSSVRTRWHVRYKKDAKGLERWLLDEARKRGFQIPR